MRILLAVVNRLAVCGLVVCGGMAAEEVRCPASVEAAKPALAKAVAGWTAVVDERRHELSNVTVYDGPVADKASLVPDGERKAGRKVEEYWKLSQNNARGYWLQCHYAATALTLVRALPKGATTCTVTANPAMTLEGRAAIESAICR